MALQVASETTHKRLTWLFLNFVVWETDQWTRHLILKRIVEYLFVRHLSPMSTNCIMHAVDQIDFSLLHGSRGIL